MREPRIQFALTDAERASPLWHRLVGYAEGRIESISRDNENPSHDTAQTSYLRGQIQAYRQLLRLSEPPRIQESPPGS